MISSSPWVWGGLVLLLSFSAGFSSSETALFGLTPAERLRAGRRVEALLARPRSLLVTILLANLAVNLMFFTFAARLAQPGHATSTLVVGLLALILMLIFGEVLPKTLALRSRVPLARVVAVPLGALVSVLEPAQRVLDHALELFYRVLGDLARPEAAGITNASLAAALEKSAERGLILESEAYLLGELVELGDVRVREIMMPRVDMQFLDLEEPDEWRATIGRAVAVRLDWLIVVEDGPDHVIGRVRMRKLLVHGLDALDADVIRGHLEPVRFVPEVASALSLLEFLRDVELAQAVVVDEWGGTAGLVTLEDVFEELVGDLLVEDEVAVKPVTDLGDGRFEIAGGLSVRDWNELFGSSEAPREFETVGGLVTAQLGRIPRVNDRVRVGGLVFTVLEMTRGRVARLEVQVDSRAAGEAR